MHPGSDCLVLGVDTCSLEQAKTGALVQSSEQTFECVKLQSGGMEGTQNG